MCKQLSTGSNCGQPWCTGDPESRRSQVPQKEDGAVTVVVHVLCRDPHIAGAGRGLGGPGQPNPPRWVIP